MIAIDKLKKDLEVGIQLGHITLEESLDLVAIEVALVLKKSINGEPPWNSKYYELMKRSGLVQDIEVPREFYLGERGGSHHLWLTEEGFYDQLYRRASSWLTALEQKK